MMSKTKKALLTTFGMIAALAALAGYLEYAEKHATPLVGRCFMASDNSGGLTVEGVKEITDNEGAKIKLYYGEEIIGPFISPFRMKKFFKIKEANEAILKMLAKGELKEVNCATGEAK